MYYIFNTTCKSVMLPTLRTAFWCRAKERNQEGEVMKRCSLVLDLEPPAVAATIVEIEDAIIANFCSDLSEIEGNGKCKDKSKFKFKKSTIQSNVRRGILPVSDDFPSVHPRLRLTMAIRQSGNNQFLDSKDCTFYGPDRKRITDVLDVGQDESVNVCCRPAWLWQSPTGSFGITWTVSCLMKKDVPVECPFPDEAPTEETDWPVPLGKRGKPDDEESRNLPIIFKIPKVAHGDFGCMTQAEVDDLEQEQGDDDE
jgi:hypothetical protein